jgi:hypothetical protein
MERKLVNPLVIILKLEAGTGLRRAYAMLLLMMVPITIALHYITTQLTF